MSAAAIQRHEARAMAAITAVLVWMSPESISPAKTSTAMDAAEPAMPVTAPRLVWPTVLPRMSL